MRASYRETVLTIQRLPLLVSREDSRYYLNGINYAQANITNALSRVLVKSANETDSNKLLSCLYENINLPENIVYALENRIPFKFHNRDEKGVRLNEVRLNLKQIGKKEFAIEISDGVWGNIAQKWVSFKYSYAFLIY